MLVCQDSNYITNDLPFQSQMLAVVETLNILECQVQFSLIINTYDVIMINVFKEEIFSPKKQIGLTFINDEIAGSVNMTFNIYCHARLSCLMLFQQ